MTDASFLETYIEQVGDSVREIFKKVHDANAEARQKSEAYRELVSRTSAALYYMDKALESARQAVQEEQQRHSKCPTPCDDDCEAGCHEVHQVAAKRTHLVADCPPRKRPKAKH